MLARLTLLAFVLLPGTAWAAGPTISSHDLPVAGQRTLAGASQVERFNLVAVHWQGPGSVELRVRVASPIGDDAFVVGHCEKQELYVTVHAFLDVA